MAILDGVIEKSEKLIVLLLSDGIEFVIMALGATDGQPQKDTSESADSVHDRFDPKLFRVNPAFLIDLSIPVKPSRNFLLNR